MAHYRPRQRVYGMLPQHEALGSLGAEEACSFAFTRPVLEMLCGHLWNAKHYTSSKQYAVRAEHRGRLLENAQMERAMQERERIQATA